MSRHITYQIHDVENQFDGEVYETLFRYIDGERSEEIFQDDDGSSPEDKFLSRSLNAFVRELRWLSEQLNSRGNEDE